ncbi:MAG: type I pullulanase [Prevotellaceae bacterium]|jgi:pullulanase|nr:type I pullulanase [Prevotellaceae bacterium]
MIDNKSVYNSFDDYPVYSGDDLGLTYSTKCSKFRFWSPAANSVKLNIYNEGLNGKPVETCIMQPDKNGTWIYKTVGDLKGKFYTFQVKINDRWLAETPGIWAKAAGVNGNRAAIIDFSETNPENWENDKKPELKSFADIIIYEVHIRDFSISPTSGITNKGKFLSFTENGTVSPEGEKTGTDHLKDLGITHIHLLPVFDFASIDETKLDENKYNWGYDPQNYNLPEGGYSTNPYEPKTRIREFKEMVKSLHSNGFRVIMDVVFNHTFFNENSNLFLTAQKYFYRYKADGSWSNASGCFNETASERQMMRKYIVDSVKYWATEYHIDGFRFDLMGIHDIKTMNEVRAALNRIDTSIFIYGEGWTANESPLSEDLRAVKRNARQLNNIAVFCDDIRDALRGNWYNPKIGGFVSGICGHEESLKAGITGAIKHHHVDYSKVKYANQAYTNAPTQLINYVSCHDDFCLMDKLKETAPANATDCELLRFNKLAQTAVFTSQGIPFIYAGEEICRNKKGIHNTFKSPDEINQINWSNKSKYKDVFNYCKGLIELRKSYSAFRMNSANEVRKNLKFIKTSNSFIAYLIDGYANNNAWEDIVVILNGNRNAVDFKLLEGRWKLLCHDGKININGIANVQGILRIEASSASILVRILN